jgi:tetratricopeptide (TPR) repeat protein
MLAQNSYGRAKELLDRALALDNDYAPALNDLGYVYAVTRNFQGAFAAMEHYVRVLPNKPNPHDSYGEILRKGGNFQGALEHYRAALKIDPTFQPSLLGIADTYAVMGDEETARKEYAKAIRAAASASDRLQYQIQLALTYVREKKYGKANDAFEQIGEQARSANLRRFESEADQLMAMYQRDNNDSLRYADRAETALLHANSLSQTEMEEERSEILKVRAIRGAESGNTEISHQALEQLLGLANASRSSKIQRSYDAAVGSVLVIEHKYPDAISHLEEDNENPCSMQRLVVAYSESGAVDKAHALELKIADINEPTIEQALIVPDLRAKLAPSKKRKPWLPRILAR